MRKVKCQVTKEGGTVSTFYRVRKGGRNLYYKDEQTYLDMVRDKELRDKLNSYVSVEILNYDGGQYLPPFFTKRINELNKLYPMEVILETFKQNKDNLQYWMGQDSKFKNETGRINYMMAIINNNINNEYEKWKVKERQNKVDNTVKVDMDLLDININNTKKENNGISDFL